MPQDRIIATESAATVITLEVKSEGTLIPGQYQVESVILQNEVNRIPTAKLVILDGSASAEQFAASDDAVFIPGKAIAIAAGYLRSETQTVFEGTVVKHSIKARSNGASVLMVECKAAPFKMTLARKSKFYAEVKDSDVMEDLLAGYGIAAEVEATQVTHAQLVQHDCSDWDFMLNRLDVNNKVCITEREKVTIAKPTLNSEPVLNLVFGGSILDLDLETDARSQYAAVETRHWNIDDREVAQDAIDDPGVRTAGNVGAPELAGTGGGETYTLTSGGTFSEAEMKDWGVSFWEKKQLSKIRGHVTFKGTHQVTTGASVALSGVGERFAGTYFVSGVLHQISAGDWQTTAQLGLNPEWFTDVYDIASKPAAGLVPPINGLQVGIVTQLQDDPDGNNRIKVNLPVVQGADEGLWARVSTLDAGNNRGTFFLPEVGDEVIVGFINDDPRSAVVLGMMNSSSSPAPLTAADDNHRKGVVTRSGMKMLFDDEKKNYVLETPAGKSVVLDEDGDVIAIKDDHGNSIQLDADGITITSGKDVVIRASQDVKTSANNIEQQASMNVNVEGSAGVDVSSSGTTVIKGSMVQIN